ncbi:MAG TPA: alpha-2-macroglobulin [Methylomirabilota bacterium]
MASTLGQSQLHRRLPAGVLVALIAVAVLSTALAAAGQTAPGPFPGAEFFLLSDASVGSNDVAVVRLEAPSLGGAYEGVDIIVYRIPKPLDFLATQRNLHRIEVPSVYAGEGAANGLRYLWSQWHRQARDSWHRLFAAPARQAVVARAPEVRSDPARWPVDPIYPAQFTPLPGYPVVDRFRYPLAQARPIEPPKDVRLPGSSSNFIAVARGNVHVPLGKRAPGLYLVEALIGSYRAATLVFVSDTVAVTKISAGELLVWTVSRQTGRPVAGAEIAWTDGLGTLKSGRTGRDGLVVLEHASPERTYVVGRDAGGGVFVSENFYYDSEIYDAKLYAFTDRPLYRPGDTVHLKVVGRELKDAVRSVPLTAAPMSVSVLDPTGTPVLTRAVELSPAAGAEVTFELPAASPAGGYDVRLDYRNSSYGAAFRVAEYVKPHFEIELGLDTPEPKTGQPIHGRVTLSYLDGSVVAGGAVQLVVKSQALTMVDAEPRYADRAPVKLERDELVTDASGSAAFTLPAVEQPSRYIVTILATDRAAYRVKTTREILVERSAALYTLAASRRFSNPGEPVTFTWQAQGPATTPPARWELVRLEDRQRTSGELDGSLGRWATSFARAGSYTLTLRDARGRVVAATTHWVTGKELAAAPGSIEIVFDRERYRPGDTARALITFAEPVEEALLTLERDRVEQRALLSAAGGWLRATRLGPTQWRAEIPVRAEHAPNVTFSVLYALRGDYVFANRGFRVEHDVVEIQLGPDKAVYVPGETVRVDVVTRVGGRPGPARLTVSVVDEMVYVLQPEIAPDIVEFFYHPRRNNVRTSSSLAFIAYDMALSSLPTPPARGARQERGVKVLERPRRDVVDTAAWLGDLRTGPDGRAHFTFRMPDALTRWRLTARAMTEAGVVGQRTGWVTSFKDVYLKWAGPTRFREGDQPLADVLVFNETPAETTVELVASGGGADSRHTLRLAPGANHVTLPVGNVSGSTVTLAVHRAGVVMDTLSTTVSGVPVTPPTPRSLTVDVTSATTALALPPDARSLSVSFAGGLAGHVAQIADDLLDYPWGCVEQTASRLIPLSLAYPTLAGAPAPMRERTARALQTHRLRLVHMAGPDAVFPWWMPNTSTSALMTSYAYYADWHASRVLGVEVPREHWAHTLGVYARHGAAEPLVQRALAVWLMGEMGLPVRTLVDGLQDDVARLTGSPESQRGPHASPLLAQPSSEVGEAMARVLVAHMAATYGLAPRPDLDAGLERARRSLRTSGLPLARALLLMTGGVAAPGEAERILAAVRRDMPTFDRALTLVWVQKALGVTPAPAMLDADVRGEWRREPGSSLGGMRWRYTGAGRPSTLELTTAPARPITAVVRYESAEPETHRLPVAIVRRLYHLAPGAAQLDFHAEPVMPGAALDGKELYLEEVTLLPAANTRVRYALLEVPLPPGADVERTTWSMKIAGNALERARHEPGDLVYAVPIDSLDGPLTIRHLVRFSQRGTFTLPPARLFRMYEPEDKALEGENSGARVMEVR